MTAADEFTVPDPTLPETERKRLDALTAVLEPHLSGWDPPAPYPDGAFQDLAETLARAALAHIDTQARPAGSDELAAPGGRP